MNLFWAGAGGLLLFAALMLITPVVMARREGRHVSVRAENLRAHREHLAELEAQRAAGELDGGELQPLREELEYSMLLDAEQAATEQDADPPAAAPGWWLPVLLTVALLVSAGALYDRLGAAQDWQLAQGLEAIGAAADPHSRKRLLETLVTRLEQKLSRDDSHTTARFLLARSQMELRRYPEAVRAYAALVERNPDEPRLLVEYAQARFAASDRVLGPETADILRQVLALDPHNQSALGLLGLGYFNHGNYAAAQRYWERALAVTADPAGRRALQAGIARAREAMGLPATPGAAQGAAAGPSIQVSVALGERAAADLAEGAAVFVFARPVNGPRMPLAAQRLRPEDLPRTVVLDDSDAMMAGMNLSGSGGEIEVLARLTRSGQPLPQSGDWESAPVRVRLAEQSGPVSLQINVQRP